MIDFSLSVPAFSTYGFIIFCFIIFILFRAANRLAKTLKVFSRFRKTVARALPMIEITVWTIFVFWAINKFLKDTFIFQTLITSVALIILLLLGWFFLRDYFAGIVLKSENLFERNQLISVGNLSGKIKKTSFRHIEFETGNGDVLKVPYSKLSSENIGKIQEQRDGARYSVKLSAAKNIPVYELREKIRGAVYNSPWHLSRKEPVIQIKEGEEQEHSIEVVVFALNSTHADFIERDLVSKFQG